MRKLLSLLSVVALMLVASLIFALPASAAITIDISGVEDVKVNGPRSLTATARGNVGEAGNLSLKAGGAELGTTSCSAIQSSCSLTKSWNPPSVNGTHDVVATATRRLGGNGASRTVQVRVNIPPVRPTNVAVALEGDAPVVTWKANPETDLKGYRVERSSSGISKSFSLGKVTRFSDPSAPTGAEVAYQVVAVRNSPVSPSGIESQPSAAARVTIPAPPPQQAPAENGAPARATADPAQATADPQAGQSGQPASGQPEEPAPAPGNPVVLAPSDPKPIEAPNLPPQVTVGPRRDVGYAPLLPYIAQLPKSSGEEAAPEPVEAEPGQGLVTPIALPNSFGRPAVQKSLYIAGALLLVVAALHIARAARRLGDLAEAE